MRLHADVVLTRIVRNRSSRDGAEIKLIVLHSTESGPVKGPADLAGVAGWFDNPAAQASAHVITDADGTSARCVPDDEKAWSCVNFNSVSLNVEQIGYASQGSWTEAELLETARWLALWSKRHGVPLRRGRTLGSTVVRRGVVTHSQLGSAGGGHSDPGAGYPTRHVLRLAKRIRAQL